MTRARRPKPIPAQDLPAEYRLQLVRIVRANMRTLEIATERLRVRAEAAAAASKVPAIDHQMTLGLLNLAKTNAELTAAYPGLLELAHGPDGGMDRVGALGGDDAARDLRAALRGGEPPPAA